MSYPRLRRSRTTLWRIMFATPGPAAVGGQLLWGDIGEPWGKCHKVKSSAVKWHFGVRPHVLRLMITIVPWHQLAESSSMHCSAECPVIPSNHISSTSESWWLECVKVRHHGFAETFPNIFHRHVQQKRGNLQTHYNNHRSTPQHQWHWQHRFQSEAASSAISSSTDLILLCSLPCWTLAHTSPRCFRWSPLPYTKTYRQRCGIIICCSSCALGSETQQPSLQNEASEACIVGAFQKNSQPLKRPTKVQ